MEHSGVDQRLAVLAESLYVANLLILPVVAFIILAVIFYKRHRDAPPLAKSHLEQTLQASLYLGIILLAIVGGVGIMHLANIEEVSIWIVGVITFTIVHATMVLFGVLGLAKAMAGKCWRYPIVGHSLPTDCPR